MSFSETLPEERAWLFAMNAHGSIQQKRKYTGMPYITHPGEVVGILRALPSTTQAMLCAAWVHDTVEDVPGITFDIVEHELGSDVAGLVREVTKISRATDGTRAERKAIDRAHYASASAQGQTLKVADIISNISTLPDLAPDFAKVYLCEAAQLLDLLGLADPQLLRQAKACLLRGFRKLRPSSCAAA
ncbi:HD domain-containing protein [Stutzerimonas stutzeri]|uniref:HD domain-containing protein n=1 Tax=Stutzerimonas stutzeri TaxID=316 RepID=UPI0015E45844|nr:HD domain-containing protein [Stutzerimonas stutzeri]MBA1280328.1 HD domain-containing protein [Stutzerimonas stutzeri]